MWWSKNTPVRRSSRHRLSFESCEPRRLMAVTTSFDNGTRTLTITGDADADDIAIFGTANPGEFTVQGRNGTTVDGGASATIGGVTGDLIIETEGGDDVLNLDNVYLAGDLTIDTSEGDDVVVFGATGVVSAAGSCTVRSNTGEDLFRAEPYKAFFGGSLLITDGAFNGAVSMIGASAGDIAVLDHSQVFMQGVTSVNQLIVQSNRNVNSIAIFTSAATGSLRVTLPSGQNSVYIDTCYSAAGITVAAFSPFLPSVPHVPEPAPYNIDDTITIARCQTRVVTVDTAGIGVRRAHSGGHDTVFLYGNYIVGPVVNNPGTRVVSVDTGDGNDTVAASYNIALGDVRVTMEDLDDTLTLVGNQITGTVVGDGGTGTNRLNLIGNQYPASSFSFFQ